MRVPQKQTERAAAPKLRDEAGSKKKKKKTSFGGTRGVRPPARKAGKGRGAAGENGPLRGRKRDLGKRSRRKPGQDEGTNPRELEKKKKNDKEHGRTRALTYRN